MQSAYTPLWVNGHFYPQQNQSSSDKTSKPCQEPVQRIFPPHFGERRTIAEIEALRLALRHKEALEYPGTMQDAVTLKQGLSFGAVWTVYHVARRLGIEQALGTTRAGNLALWQVMARVLDQGSRLSAVRLAMAHAACDVLGLGTFD